MIHGKEVVPVRVVGSVNKEAGQTRPSPKQLRPGSLLKAQGYCVACPDPSLRKKHSLGMTSFRKPSAAIDAGFGVVIAPIEPIVFQRGQFLKTLTVHCAGSGAALEVPLAGGFGINQRPVCGVAGTEYLNVFPGGAAHEGAD